LSNIVAADVDKALAEMNQLTALVNDALERTP
jgi:hypothetical protein